MFTVADRERIQQEIIDWAEADEHVIGAALVGSSATGLQDDLSDIDLMLQISDAAELDSVIELWTTRLLESFDIAHTLDVVAGNGVLYRVFLTKSSMQMDISFWPEQEFRATGERFNLLFGEANPATASPEPDPEKLIGMAWLYAIHVRSAIARNEPWHALSLLDDLRDYVLTLVCIRHGENAHQLRGVDQLPDGVLESFHHARPEAVTAAELARSLREHTHLLLKEASHIDSHLAASLATPLRLIGEFHSGGNPTS